MSATERITAAQYRAIMAGTAHGTPQPDDAPKKRKPAHKRGIMNSTETEYANRLEALKRVGEIQGYQFEVMTLTLAPDTTLTPDFVVWTSTGVEIHEVKGAHVWEDSWIKFKIAADKFPWAKWYWCQKKDGQWLVNERPSNG